MKVTYDIFLHMMECLHLKQPAACNWQNITIALLASGSMKVFFEFLPMSPNKFIHSGNPLQKKKNLATLHANKINKN
jgi:hypothetical protein